MTHHPLLGLVAATHTPFDADGELHLPSVERQAEHLLDWGVKQVFIGGSTGESASLSYVERDALTRRWTEVAVGTELRVIVHVGGNCLREAGALAATAQACGAAAVAMLTPSYFKPANVDVLLECCASVAAHAPELPFYYYDIPVMTGVLLPMADFLARGRERIPNLAGLKWTNPDLFNYQRCRAADGGSFDLLWGTDEALLAALAVGARGAVGSTYNLAAPLYHRLIAAFEAGDMAAARAEQLRSVELVRTLAGYGFMGAAKAVMGMLGVPVGPARLPNTNPSAEQLPKLRAELEQLGFFDWLA